MITEFGSGINDVFHKLCTEAQGWPVETRRGGDKLLDSPSPVCAIIADPQRRVLNIPYRNNSLPAQCAETLWVLAGRNDIDWLKFYLPRAPDFSDDGKTWRAGYGPRLRNYGEGLIIRMPKRKLEPNQHVVEGIDRTDQLKFVVDKLNKFPQDRQAVMTLLSPVEDMASDLVTKDFPCTQSLSFMVRNGRLDLTVFIRSNDLIWGWSGVNVFELTVLQELVANMTGLPIGNYYHISNNLHVYERHWNLVGKIAGVDTDRVMAPYWKDPKYARFDSLTQLDQQLKDFFRLEELVRNHASVTADYFRGTRIYQGTLLDDLMNVVFAYCAHKRGSPKVAHYARAMILDPAMQESYDRFIAWEQRPRIPRLETE